MSGRRIHDMAMQRREKRKRKEKEKEREREERKEKKRGPGQREESHMYIWGRGVVERLQFLQFPQAIGKSPVFENL